MGSAVARYTTGRDALVARFEAGLSPAMARVLAAFRLEVCSRRLWQVVGVRGEQANAACAVAGSSGRFVRGVRDAALLANLLP